MSYAPCGALIDAGAIVTDHWLAYGWYSSALGRAVLRFLAHHFLRSMSANIEHRPSMTRVTRRPVFGSTLPAAAWYFNYEVFRFLRAEKPKHEDDLPYLPQT